jgi:hypothetical protein
MPSSLEGTSLLAERLLHQMDRRRALAFLPRFRNRKTRIITSAGSAGILIAAALVGSLYSSDAAVADCQPNPVVCENALDGSPSSEWDIYKAGDETVQGFATDMSVDAGETVKFKVRAEHAYTIDIYRLGYYDGDGARKVQSLEGTFPAQNQDTACVTDSTTLIYDCGTWAQSATWQVPATAVSGVYFALLKRTDTGGKSHVTFIVRKDSSHSDVIFKTSDATWQAYNVYGGADFYNDGPNGRATKLSYNRPFATRGWNNGRDFLFSNEYPTIRFLERNGYDVTYTTDVDADRNGSLLQNHDVFLSVGHDEYWSGPQRAAVEAARDAGTNLAFLSGNEVYWKTRWETSQDGSNTAHRTLVCYKETWANDKSDPSEEWTGTWRDPRFSPPSNGGKPENALTGTIFMANHDDLAIQVPAAQGKNRFWRNSDVAEQAAGTKMTLSPHTVGYESDEDLDNGFRPAGLIRLSTTVGETPEYVRDFGNTVSPGTTTHHLTLYRAASGALVFGAGTVQYGWGLDAEHDTEFAQEPADEQIQQATVNLLADMGVQPATLMGTLQPASKSTDTAGPTTTITTPAADSTVANGKLVTVSGTADDNDGGRVAGVEVSLDNGKTWHPAEGTDEWSYKGAVTGSGTTTIKVRSTDDSANIGAVKSRVLTLTGSTSLFGKTVPENPSINDSDAVELGVKVIPQTSGFIKGVRFYKGEGNTGTHVGTLWSADGDVLARGTFQDETETGWQELVFSSAVAVTEGVTYVASYTAPNGHYAGDKWAFIYGPHEASPLVAPSTHQAGGNGVYEIAGRFPTKSHQSTNYYVDVLFNVGNVTPPAVTGTAPLSYAAYLATSTRPVVTFSKAVDPESVDFDVTYTGGTVAGTVDYDADTRRATFIPSSALPAGKKITVAVTAADPDGNAMAAPYTWWFTTNPGNVEVHALFGETDLPAVAAVDEPAAVNLGVKFVPQADGKVVGMRFFKGPGNTGTHTGSVWSSSGSRLRTATFVNETATGWQYVYFSEALTVTAGTTYTVSYHAPQGDYAVTGSYFTAERQRGLLTAPAGNNGVYQYGADGFPSSSWSSGNYWVDPLFASTAEAPEEPTTPQLPQNTVNLFPGAPVPAHASWDDSNGVEIGARFSSDVAGKVHGVRFYKGNGNTGTHTGTLWSADGSVLRTGTFVNETTDGWQTLVFDQPVSIVAGTEYVVSYYAPNGHYAVTGGGLASATENSPLRTVAGGARYQYGGGFPTGTSTANYWVDVYFTPAA